MTRRRSRIWVVGLCTVLLTVCSGEDPAITALRQVEETDTADRATLIAFYNATGGPNWGDRTNWHTPESIRNWEGVSTNSAGFVTELSLSENDLSGTLPPVLGDLAQLRRLVLTDNRLTGPIPPELGQLSQLTRLDLHRNRLNGTIPTELGALPRLDFPGALRQRAVRHDSGRAGNPEYSPTAVPVGEPAIGFDPARTIYKPHK